MFTQFYHNTTKKYISLFGRLFSNININKYDSTGAVIKTIEVPIGYGSKEKYIRRLIENSSIDSGNTKVKVTAPRMSFIMGSPSYDGFRKTNSTNKISVVEYDTEGKTRKVQYQRIPYNFPMTLNILTKYQDEGFQIVEQILPYFTPEFTVNILEIPDMEIYSDIPIVLETVSKNDESVDGDFDTTRILEWQLDFMLKGWYYKPISDSSVILKVQSNIRNFNNFDEVWKEIIVEDE